MKIQVKFRLIFVFLLMFNLSLSQIGGSLDTLQIKAYVNISYKNFKPKHIEVKKIFCDYCSKKQNHYLKLLAWQRAHAIRNSKDFKMQNGKRMLTFMIRLPKSELKSYRN